MIIEIKRPQTESINDIKPGEVFEHDKHYFIKLSESFVEDNGMPRNAVRLDNGDLYTFFDDINYEMPIIPVKARIDIEDMRYMT